MIDEVFVELDGRQYCWSYDASITSADECWDWADMTQFIKPPVIIRARLNRIFIESKASDIAISLDYHDDPQRLYDLLISMGATDADFHKDAALVELLAYRRTSGSSEPVGWQHQSPLAAMDYKVGEKGLPPSQRHAILRAAFEHEIPTVGTDEYMSEWGKPGSAARLKKIANSLASNCQKMKRKVGGSNKAISDWENDLNWLKVTFYDGFQWPRESSYRDHFNWPSTVI